MTLGEKIKERRIELGMSQDELAKKLGYTNRSTISRIEKDETDPPLSKLVAYAEALQTTPENLLSSVEPISEDKEVALVKKLVDSKIPSFDSAGLGNVVFKDNMFDRYHALFDLVKDATPEEMDQIEQIIKVIVKGNKKDD